MPSLFDFHYSVKKKPFAEFKKVSSAVLVSKLIGTVLAYHITEEVPRKYDCCYPTNRVLLFVAVIIVLKRHCCMEPKEINPHKIK